MWRRNVCMFSECMKVASSIIELVIYSDSSSKMQLSILGKDLQYTMNKLPTLNELDFTNIMINLMAVMEHMAKEGIVHGDIKGILCTCSLV